MIGIISLCNTRFKHFYVSRKWIQICIFIINGSINLWTNLGFNCIIEYKILCDISVFSVFKIVNYI